MLGVLTKKTIKEAVCKQLQLCIFHLQGCLSCEDYPSLTLEVMHFDALLDLLMLKINIDTYLRYYQSLFSSVEDYYFCDYCPQISTLEKRKRDYVRISDKTIYFVEVLKICSNNMKKYIEDENYEALKNEIYYNHNVPSLITTNSNDLIKYYLEIECKGFKKNCSKEILQAYDAVWTKIRKVNGL